MLYYESRYIRTRENRTGEAMAKFPFSCLNLALAKPYDGAREIEAPVVWYAFTDDGDYTAVNIMGYGAGVLRRPLSGMGSKLMDRLRAILRDLIKTESNGD
jgi:hypothetical protein